MPHLKQDTTQNWKKVTSWTQKISQFTKYELLVFNGMLPWEDTTYNTRLIYWKDSINNQEKYI